MVLDSCDQLHRVAASRLLSPFATRAFVPFDDAKVLHFSPSSKFRVSTTCKNLLMK